MSLLKMEFEPVALLWTARTCVRGGLGNRLFQLAALVGYCERSSVHIPVVYDVDIEPNPHGSPDAVLDMFPMIVRKRACLTSVQEQCFREKSPFSAESIPIVKANVVLTGYRQAADYITRHDGTMILPILSDLHDRSPRSLFPDTVFEHAAFMHVRRGDYVGSVHDLPLRIYYEACIKELFLFFKRKNSSCRLHVVLLSDDPAWAQLQYKNIIRGQALDLNIEVSLDCETLAHELTDVECLTIMASCAIGGICANSSLSWWGACLSYAQHKSFSYFPSAWVAARSKLASFKVDYPPWAHVCDVHTGIITNSKQDCIDASFVFFEGIDFDGTNLVKFSASPKEQMLRASKMSDCIAFNSLGFFKAWQSDFSMLAAQCRPSPYFKPGDGIYVKASIATVWLTEWIKLQHHYVFMTRVTIKGVCESQGDRHDADIPLLTKLKSALERSTCLAVTGEGECLGALTALEPACTNGTGIWIKRVEVDAHSIVQATCHLRSLPVSPKVPETPRTISKVAFITALYGGYELSCKPVVAQSVPCDCIAFVDTSPIATAGWIIDTFPYHVHFATMDVKDKDEFVNKTNTHPFMIAKFYKQAFYHIPRLQQYDTIIWIDGTVEIKHTDAAKIAQSRLQYFDIPVLSWQHEHRLSSGLAGEVAASIDFDRYCSTMWNGHAQPFQPIARQFKTYIDEGYEDAWFEGPSVAVTCFVAFNMRHIQTTPFLQTWYRQTRTFSTQDQIGFSYTCWKQKVKPYLFPDYAVKGTRPHVSTDLYIKHDHRK